MTDRFKEDKAESLLNVNILEKEFNLDLSEDRKKQIEEIQSMRKELEKASEFPDSEKILHDNIGRANRLLDRIEIEVGNGQVNARLFEVSAQLINAITSATTSISGNIFHDMKHEYNMKMLEVKERELAVKQAMYGGGSLSDGSGKTNLLVTDRESLLKLIQGEEESVVNSAPDDD